MARRLDNSNYIVMKKNLRPRKRNIGEDESIIRKNLNTFIQAFFGCQNGLQVETSASFAAFLDQVGVTRKNYDLFFKMLETNNKWVADALIGSREPRLLFSSIPPNKVLIRKAFRLLSFLHPKQIYPKILQAVLGIIENVYYNPDDGFNTHKLKLNDIDNIGKFLDKEQNQENPENQMILNILDKITRLGEYKEDLTKSILGKHAFNIRFAYFDHRKRLEDVIPQLLLIKIPREESEVKPSENFLNFIKKSKQPTGKNKDEE